MHWRSLKAEVGVLTCETLVCFRLVARQARTPARQKPRQYHARPGLVCRFVIDFCQSAQPNGAAVGLRGHCSDEEYN